MISQLTMECHSLPQYKDANYSNEDVTPEHKFTLEELLLFHIIIMLNT